MAGAYDLAHKLLIMNGTKGDQGTKLYHLLLIKSLNFLTLINIKAFTNGCLLLVTMLLLIGFYNTHKYIQCESVSYVHKYMYVRKYMIFDAVKVIVGSVSVFKRFCENYIRMMQSQ